MQPSVSESNKMNQLRSVVVAGGSGRLGKHLIPKLLEANYHVTVITRDAKASESRLAASGSGQDLGRGGRGVLDFVTADYQSIPSLTEALSQHKYESLVILLNRILADEQINVTEAAIAAGIPHVMPSCYSFSFADDRLRGIPFYIAKYKVQDHFSRAASDDRIAFSGILTGAFQQYALDNDLFVNLKGSAPSVRWDGGDKTITLTREEDAAQAVLGVLKLPREQVKNRFFYVQSSTFSVNQALQYAQEAAPERDFAVVDKDAAQAGEEAWQALGSSAEGTIDIGTTGKFIAWITYSLRMWQFDKPDNELLGIRQWTDAEIKKEITERVKRLSENN